MFLKSRKFKISSTVLPYTSYCDCSDSVQPHCIILVHILLPEWR